MTKVAPVELANQLVATNQVVSDACGISPVLMRPCGGAKTVEGMNIAGAISMPAILWSVDTLDWKTRDASQTIQTCLLYTSRSCSPALPLPVQLPSLPSSFAHVRKPQPPAHRSERSCLLYTSFTRNAENQPFCTQVHAVKVAGRRLILDHDEG